MCREAVWIYDLASDHSKELEMLWAQWLWGVFLMKENGTESTANITKDGLHLLQIIKSLSKLEPYLMTHLF